MAGINQFKHVELTRRIIGCAMKVHRYLGSGFPEIVYQNALLIELRRKDIPAKAEVEAVVKYYDKIVGKRRIDIVVDNKVLLELKAITETNSLCHNQVINYLRVLNFEVGLLLNFGKESLEFKRFANYSSLSDEND